VSWRGERAVVLPAAALPEGGRSVVEAFGTTVAVNNRCPHRGGPLCHGTVGGAPLPSEPHRYVWGLEDRVLVCPWHGWEFDLASGETLFDRRVAVRGYDVAVEDDDIVLYRR
jgi:nitrite reductase/ring-hydroxylating ferredoxin subunit